MALDNDVGFRSKVSIAGRQRSGEIDAVSSDDIADWLDIQ